MHYMDTLYELLSKTVKVEESLPVFEFSSTVLGTSVTSSTKTEPLTYTFLFL